LVTCEHNIHADETDHRTFLPVVWSIDTQYFANNFGRNHPSDQTSFFLFVSPLFGEMATCC